jgi:hypothetical protein
MRHSIYSLFVYFYFFFWVIFFTASLEIRYQWIKKGRLTEKGGIGYTQLHIMVEEAVLGKCVMTWAGFEANTKIACMSACRVIKCGLLLYTHLRPFSYLCSRPPLGKNKRRLSLAAFGDDMVDTRDIEIVNNCETSWH